MFHFKNKRGRNFSKKLDLEKSFKMLLQQLICSFNESVRTLPNNSNAEDFE